MKLDESKRRSNEKSSEKQEWISGQWCVDSGFVMARRCWRCCGAADGGNWIDGIYYANDNSGLINLTLMTSDRSFCHSYISPSRSLALCVISLTSLSLSTVPPSRCLVLTYFVCIRTDITCILTGSFENEILQWVARYSQSRRR